MKKILSCAAAVIALMAAASADAATAPDVRPGMLYPTARANLIRAGVMPENVGRHHSSCPTEEEADCDAYPELITCSGGNLVRCSFLFSAGDRYIVVTTQGELLERAKVIHFQAATRADLAAVERIR